MSDDLGESWSSTLPAGVGDRVFQEVDGIFQVLAARGEKVLGSP